ncbi:MFS transporter [Amycolatopsis benzoatilytica]|uniref:MFS transporter n=1 Tax=Amycolatopsis benzoatilytica TaxID=346045 RepID=UPI0003725D22|nr:MFS transporter [Amycolatopsis benzoatilytica]
MHTKLIGIALAYFMVLLDTTVLAVAEPDLIASLRTDVIGVGWAITSYTMALAAALVLGGSLADRLGAHRVFVAGVAGFGAVSLACAFAPGLAVLLAGRVLLGLFAAAIIPSSLGLIAILYPEPGPRGRAISAWAAISGAAMAAGPVLGGWLIELSGWRAVFVLNAPLAIVVLLLCRKPIPAPRRADSISWLPHLALAATLAVLTLAITEAGQRRWPLALLFGLSTVLIGRFAMSADRRAVVPLIPEPLRRNAAAWTAFGWGAAVNYALTTVLFAIPLLLHVSALEAGAALLPLTLLVALNPLVTGRLVAARGPLLPIRLGFAAFPVGLCLTAFAAHALLRGIGLLLCGLGVSWTLPALVGFAVSHAPPEATGAVGGLLNATRQIGATVAAAVASVTLAQPSPVPFVIAAVICGFGFASTRGW